MVNVIVIEGPDGAGKTTLMHKIEAAMFEYGVVPGAHTGTVNRDRMWETTVDRTYDAIARDLNPAKPVLMWDRLFYSELVYAPIMLRPLAFTPNEVKYVHRLLAFTGSVVIFCMPGRETTLQNCRKTEQHSWVMGNEARIYDKYMHVVRRYANENTLLWNYHQEEQDWPWLINNLRSYINRRKAMA